jgi:DHA2 family metal-tetracycline-proton antiporter-like MFS transporter
MIAATRYFPSDLKGKMLGIIASTVALAAGTGPILGGFISGTLHWRYLFLTTLLTVFSIPFLRKFIPDEKKRNHSFDTAGAVLIACSMSLLLVFVTQGRMWTLPAAVIMLPLFYFHIKRTEFPFVSPVLFSNRIYRNSIITTFLSIGTVFGMMFMVPIMLSDLNGLDASRIGLAVFPGAVSAVIMGVIGGRLCDRKGSRFVVYTGSGLMIAGFVILSSSAGYAPWIITLELIFSYAGFAFLQSALPHTISDVLSAGQTGIGMGIFNLFFFISGAFSTAGIGRVLDFGSSGFSLNPLNPHADGWIYSNIFIMLAVIVAAALIIFHMTVARK